MALNPKAWLDTLRTVDRLLTLEKSHRAMLDKLAEEVQALKDRVTNLEAREGIVVAEAKGAAAAVASTVTSQHIVSLAQTLGQLQGRLDGLSRKLPPPLDQD